ncbi:MAG: cell division protein ZapA [Ruminococcus sp.]|nr:cell division protein ZapA [Ruminococcus sp.]
MKQEVTVKIFNREYKLLTDESKEYTAELAAALNHRLEDLLKGKSTLTVQDGAALIALEACDDLYKTRTNLENIRSQIKVYFDDAANAKARAEAAEKEAAALKERIAQLEKEIKLRKSFAPDDDISASDMIAKDISDALGGSPVSGYGFPKK